MNTIYDVIVCGHLCLDFIPEMDHVPPHALNTPGHLFEVGLLSISTGGVVSNTGLALHRLGVKVGLLATIGDDLIGDMTSAFLADRDPVLVELITRQPNTASAYTVVLSPGRADRLFLHHLGPNATFGLANIDFALPGKTRLFHLGYPPLLPHMAAQAGHELSETFRRARAAGAITSLDTTLPDQHSPAGSLDWKTILTNTLPHVDIFIPSIEEIMFMLRRQDYDAWHGQVLAHLDHAYLAGLADDLLSMGAAITGFKLSHQGIYLKTAAHERISRLPGLDAAAWGAVELVAPAYEVEVVGTIGAGDCAYAGFLTALLRGLPPQEALRWACAVGACNVEAIDATSGVQSWQATADRMAAGWRQKPLTIPGLK